MKWTISSRCFTPQSPENLEEAIFCELPKEIYGKGYTESSRSPPLKKGGWGISIGSITP
jgi:hypothetical protein